MKYSTSTTILQYADCKIKLLLNVVLNYFTTQQEAIQPHRSPEKTQLRNAKYDYTTMLIKRENKTDLPFEKLNGLYL